MSDIPSAGLPSLLMEAARSAAVADGLVPPVDNAVEDKKAPSTNGIKDGHDVAAAALAMVASGKSGNNENALQSPGVLGHSKSPLVAGLHQSKQPNGVNGVPVIKSEETNENSTCLTSQSAALVATMASAVSHQKPAEKAPVNTAQVSGPAPSAGAAAHMLASVAAKASPAPPIGLQKTSAPAPQQHASSPSPAQQSQSSGTNGNSSKKKGPPLRRGKWTAEEEAYANRLILEFKAGLLPLTDGTTLRTFLSKLLNCDPMRISKKFVGSNCIGKQVFRRRTADINRLTADQIQQSRAELSELERRFLERVAQTNRVKSSGVGGQAGGGAASNAAAAVSAAVVKPKLEQPDHIGMQSPPSPPWLKPPIGYQPGTGAATATSALSAGNPSNRAAAAAGRALLQGVVGSNGGLKASVDRRSPKPTITSAESAGLLALAEMQRQQSQNALLQAALTSNPASASNLLAAAAAANSVGANNATASVAGLSAQAMAQIARNSSAAKLANLAAAGNSMSNLMLKAGLSREQLTQLAKEQKLASSTSLSNLMERQSSFDALMSLDFRSLQSIDNLANLIQTGGGLAGQIPKSGMKNWDGNPAPVSSHASNINLAAAAAALGSQGNLAALANARHLASQDRMESLIRSMSNGAVSKSTSSTGGSNANFGNILQSMQNSLGAAGNSAGNLFGSTSAVNLANLRVESSTGLSTLRMQDGLTQRNSSVDDFLSLVASGDIPHQDPQMLDVPLQNIMQQQQQQQQAAAAQNLNTSGAQAAATLLAQQQLLAQAANNGNHALTNALSSQGLNALGNNSAASLLSQLAASQGSANAAAAAFAQQQQQARAAQMNMSASALAAARAQQNESTGSLKRKLSETNTNGFLGQGAPKR